jgi:hypothetical protein
VPLFVDLSQRRHTKRSLSSSKPKMPFRISRTRGTADHSTWNSPGATIDPSIQQRLCHLLHGAARAAFCARIVRCVFFLPKFNTFVFLDAGARSGCSFGGEALVLPKYLAKCTRQYVTTLQQSSLLCPHLRSRTFDLHINLHMLMPYLLRFFVAQDPMGIKVVCG